MSLTACAVLGAAPAAQAYVYWSDHGSFWTGVGTMIGRGNLDGSGVNSALITDPAHPVVIAVDAGHIYWSAAKSIGRANLDGSGANPNFVAAPAGASGIATDGTYIYWTDGLRYVGRANLDGSGAPNPHCIDAGSTKPIPIGIAVAAGRIYLGEGAPTQIAAVDAVCNHTPTLLTAINTAFAPIELAVSGSYLYFPATPNSNGVIDRVLTTGGLTVPVVTGLGSPTAVAVDSAYVYWADNMTGEIGRASLKNLSSPVQS